MFIVSKDARLAINIAHNDVKSLSIKKDHAGLFNLLITYTDYCGKLGNEELSWYSERKLAEFVMSEIFKGFKDGRRVYLVPSEDDARIEFMFSQNVYEAH